MISDLREDATKIGYEVSFTRPKLLRMRKFYDSYAGTGNEKVSALLRQLLWTHHLIILAIEKEAEGLLYGLLKDRAK